MRSVHDQVLHEDAVDTGVLLHRARQAIAIMQRVEQVVARDGHDGVSQPVYAVEVVERPALLARDAGADRVEVAQQLRPPRGEGHALQHAVVVARAAGIVAMAKRLREIAVLASRGLADRVRDRMAQPLQVGIGRVPRLQIGERRGHALLRDDRAVMLLVAPQATRGSLGQCSPAGALHVLNT